MSVSRRRLRSMAAVAIAAGLAIGTAACSKNNEPAAPTKPGEKTTVVLQTFGNFGYDEAIKNFEAANTDIKVDHQKMGELKDFQPKLVQSLAAGSGAGDVVALEEGVLFGYVQNPDKFADLNTLGAAELKANFPEWKINNATTPDGKKIIALGTDVGGLGICYRKDLFAKAKLPTDRAAVSELISTWDKYLAAGKQFKASGVKEAWLDSATSVMQPYVMQNADTFFFDKENKFIGDTNPAVKKAWDMGLQMAADGLTAKTARWSPDWDAAFKNSAFATIFCPSWMTEGVIKPKSGDANAGKWDVATMPGGSGNWGGSYLGIPEQSKKKEAAFKLVKYLTSKEGHLSAYKNGGGMPSDLAGLEDPAFKDSKSAYFSDAPVGQIFGDSVKNLKPIFLGPKHTQLWEKIFEPQMQAAERGKLTPDAAWQKAVTEGKAAAAG